jgi:phenylalanyl-tRNA synthetase alpha chain
MLAKGMDDIRLLRSADPRVAAQMLDLRPYRPVSSMPPMRRDLSVAVAADTTPELVGDRARAILGADAGSVEEIEVLAETGYADLPAAARDRLGVLPGQKNLLVRLIVRDHERTLTAADANRLRDRVYGGLHAGTAYEWAGDAYDPPV